MEALLTSQDLFEEFDHDLLLGDAEVVLHRQDHGVGGGVEGVGLDGIVQHIGKGDLGGEGVAVVNDGLPVVPIPHIHWGKGER